MTIEDQITDEKLQYDINRGTAKISALSSGKYEYLTGEELLPSNQQQIIEQAKFAYSTLGKAYEKQIKIIEDQREKQFNALKSLESLKPKEVKSEETKPIDYDDYCINRIAETRDQSRKIDFNNLTYIFKGKTAPANFIGFKGPLHIFKGIYSGDITLEDVEEDKKKLKAELGRIKQGDPKDK